MKGDANASLLSAWHMVKRMGYTLTLRSLSCAEFPGSRGHARCKGVAYGGGVAVGDVLDLDHVERLDGGAEALLDGLRGDQGRGGGGPLHGEQLGQSCQGGRPCHRLGS